MMKSKFMKALVLSAYLVSFSTSAVFAAEVGGGNSASSGKIEVDNKMYEKQAEIDKFLFEEHAKEIAERGFKITHTVALDHYIEIGITPYSDANADYLYEALGKDTIKVVEGDQAVIFKTQVDYMQAADTGVATEPKEVLPEDAAVADTASDTSVVTDAVLYDTSIAEAGMAAEDTDASKAEMQITSVETTAVGTVADDSEVLAYATGAADSKASNPVVPAALACTAGAAVIIGGTVVWIRFRKTVKK